MRRIVGLLALALIVLTGCRTGGSEAPEPPATTPPADPVAVLTDSMTKSIESTVQLDATVTSGPFVIQFTASVDPTARALTFAMTKPEPLEVLGVGETLYVKQGDSSWLQVDVNRLKPTSELRQALDVRSQTGIMGGIVSAESVGPGRYKGVADLNKAAAAAPESQRDSLEQAASIAKNASAVPFEATVDDQGRLTSLSYTIEAPPGPVVTELTLGKFGEPVTVTPPPADQVRPAPDSVYEVL
jgi:hypothetical protein